MGPYKLLSLTIVLASLAGCRGWTSDEPPVHINPNMDTQPKLRAYRASEFFADGKAMRQPPEGTVSRTLSGTDLRDADFLALDDHYYRGVVNGEVVNTPPAGIVVNEALLERGRERYNIYCSPCHAQHGTGNGLVAERLTIKPPTFHDDVRYKRPLGYFYRAITHGVPMPETRATPDAVNMPSYAMQVPPADRWAISLYIRALQRVTAKGALPAAEPMTVTGVQPTETAEQPVVEDEAATIPPLDGNTPTGGGAVPATKQPVAEKPVIGEGRMPENPTPSPPESGSEGAEEQP